MTVEYSHSLPHIQDIFDALLVKKEKFLWEEEQENAFGVLN